MDRRYKLLEEQRARDIDAYNRKVRRKKDGELLPRIVVLIDELADLMMSAPDQTEHNLVRLAQMARATGIHLVLATQRPSTDVVTGLIKANFPARLSFAVASSVDSRVVLDTQGAESLLGNGDMLFLPPEAGSPLRAQGVLVTDLEVEKVINYWRELWPAEENAVIPWDEVMQKEAELEARDTLVEKAIKLVQESQRASASMLQRRLRVGYPRAARLIDQLEELGIVGPSQGPGKDRDILIGPDWEDWEN
jgi:S-DNA-T family DNA segregation ATPase FtsK/SpoIIIE